VSRSHTQGRVKLIILEIDFIKATLMQCHIIPIFPQFFSGGVQRFPVRVNSYGFAAKFAKYYSDELSAAAAHFENV